MRHNNEIDRLRHHRKWLWLHLKYRFKVLRIFFWNLVLFGLNFIQQRLIPNFFWSIWSYLNYKFKIRNWKTQNINEFEWTLLLQPFCRLLLKLLRTQLSKFDIKYLSNYKRGKYLMHYFLISWISRVVQQPSSQCSTMHVWGCFGR